MLIAGCPASRLLACIAAGALAAGCKKSEPEGEPDPAPPESAKPAPPEPTVDLEPPPPPPSPGATLEGLTTPWGEQVPADHEHPEGVPITVFDIGGQIYDLSIRDLPAINGDGDVAYARSVTVGDLDYSTLSLVIAGADGAVKEELAIFDAKADGGDRDEPLPLEQVRSRARRANARLARESWRPMIALEATGPLSGGADQRLVSRDRAIAATFREPVLTVRSRETTAVIDGVAWSKKSCPADDSERGNVLLSGIWFDPPSGVVVARIGYEGTVNCTADPVFAVARAR